MQRALFLFVLGVAGTATAQVTFPSFSQGAFYTEDLSWKHLGWRSRSRYVAFDAEMNGAGAIEDFRRFVVSAPGNAIVKQWRQSEGDNDVPLATQSAAWFASHPSSGVGSTKFTFAGPYFINNKIPKVSQLRTQLTFSHGGRSYRLQLTNAYGTIEKNPDGIKAFRRAKFTLKIRKGAGAYRILQHDTSFFRSVLMYGIDRVIVSPNGQNVAVYLVRYEASFFEGWNVATERMVVTGRL